MKILYEISSAGQTQPESRWNHNGDRGVSFCASAKFQGKSTNGELLTGFEEFSPRIWPYTTKEADEQLTPEDDWYDMKGKRKTLPIPVYLLYSKKTTGVAMLVGIDEKNL